MTERGPRKKRTRAVSRMASRDEDEGAVGSYRVRRVAWRGWGGGLPGHREWYIYVG